MKKISIHRVSDKSGSKFYTPITNNILQNKNLRLQEVGLLTYLLSKPKDYNVIQKNIQKDCKTRISKGAFLTAWQRLVEKGYIVKGEFKVNNLTRVRWDIFENPVDRESQNPDTRGSLPLQSTEIQNTEIESKDLESNNNSNNGPNILGQNYSPAVTDEYLKIIKEAHTKAAKFLSDATSIGEEIFQFEDPTKFPLLLERIGKDEFKKIEKKLSIYCDTAKMLRIK